MRTYQLELNEDQADTLIRALDTYSRILIGQLEVVESVLRFSSTVPPRAERDPDLRYDYLTMVEQRLMEAKRTLGWLDHGSYGIHNKQVDDSARVAFDMLQVLRHRLAWDRAGKNPETEGLTPEMTGIHFDTPHSTTLLPMKFPLIRIQPITDTKD